MGKAPLTGIPVPGPASIYVGIGMVLEVGMGTVKSPPHPVVIPSYYLF